MYFQAILLSFLFLFTSAFYACEEEKQNITSTDDKTVEMISDTTGIDPSSLAKVLSVSVTGQPDAYQFSVEISSPDLGCDQYANWWEVISEDQQLLYRRILAHSHVNEQPFTRSGGPIDIGENTFVWVRAHMNNTGYGIEVMGGSVAQGFKADTLASGFADSLANEAPLPNGCAF